MGRGLASGKGEGLGARFLVDAEVGFVENDFGIGGFAGGDDKGVSAPSRVVLVGQGIVFVDGIFKKLNFLAIANGDDTDPSIFFSADAEELGGGGFGCGGGGGLDGGQRGGGSVGGFASFDGERGFDEAVWCG